MRSPAGAEQLATTSAGDGSHPAIVRLSPGGLLELLQHFVSYDDAILQLISGISSRAGWPHLGHCGGAVRSRSCSAMDRETSKRSPHAAHWNSYRAILCISRCLIQLT